MKINTKEIGINKYGAAQIIEVFVNSSDGSSTIKEYVTDLKGRVDESFIKSLKDLVESLEEQNRLIGEK